MRKLLLLLVLVFLSLLVAAGPAQALNLPLAPVTSAVAGEEPEEDESEEESEAGETDLGEDDEDCEWFVEEGESCAEAEELAQAEECILEDATATVAVAPGNNTVRLTIRYRAYASSAVAIDARLRGGKGGLHLGAIRTRFRLVGVFHESFGLSEKEIGRALAAREFAIDLRAVNTPASCRLRLTAHRGAARKLLWS